MAYEYEKYIKNAIGTEAVFSHEKEKRQERVQELQEVYSKAKAFDNYIVDLAKTMEVFPHDYIKSDNFAKETYDFYMKSKEDFIKAYENEVGRKHELIHDVAEYDRLLSSLEETK
ncbi:hypothetical protein LDK94_06670 [Staphylococcus arlettae]|uniref:hypothetical protein n=1 Tax=Staphylococcus arlettae TaxID=29378 RepID=UPI001E345726|nr:hypothetical protein [Staphylococcus arlettae]MCD9055018.1 hypothetical protein [Staphylococcus arlettae]